MSIARTGSAAPVKVARKTGRPRLVQWCQAGLARCHLCPFQIPCPDNHTRRPQSALRDHYARCHDGMCPSGLHSGEEMPTTVAALSADQEAAWRCRFCSQGISLEAAQSAGEARLVRDKRRHRTEAHPHISWKIWHRASYGDRAYTATCTRYRQTEAVRNKRWMMAPGPSFDGRCGMHAKVNPLGNSLLLGCARFVEPPLRS